MKNDNENIDNQEGHREAKFQKSVIVGLWRQGCSTEQISVELNVKHHRVESVLENYFSSTMDEIKNSR